jgi:hypothetical protein
MSKETKTSGKEGKSPFKYKSYSVDEIMAAGGPVAFAEKLGKNPQNILARLKALPKDAFFTEEEAQLALDTLSKTK